MKGPQELSTVDDSLIDISKSEKMDNSLDIQAEDNGKSNRYTSLFPIPNHSLLLW